MQKSIQDGYDQLDAYIVNQARRIAQEHGQGHHNHVGRVFKQASEATRPSNQCQQATDTEAKVIISFIHTVLQKHEELVAAEYIGLQSEAALPEIV